MVIESYIKLLPCIAIIFELLGMMPSTMMINHSGIRNAISFDNALLASSPLESKDEMSLKEQKAPVCELEYLFKLLQMCHESMLLITC